MSVQRKLSMAQLQENLGSVFSLPRSGGGRGSWVAHPKSHSLSIMTLGLRMPNPSSSAGPSIIPNYSLSHILNQIPHRRTTHTPQQKPQTSQDSHKRLLGSAVWIIPTAWYHLLTGLLDNRGDTQGLEYKDNDSHRSSNTCWLCDLRHVAWLLWAFLLPCKIGENTSVLLYGCEDLMHWCTHIKLSTMSLISI